MRNRTPKQPRFVSPSRDRAPLLLKTDTRKKTGPSQPRVKIHFLGSAGEVTGSLILVEVFREKSVTRFLLEAGLHQEKDEVNTCHRLPKGLTAKDIDFIVISHAHIDHSGYLPKLIKDGFTGSAYTHAATRDLLRFLLPDSGHLQEKRAEDQKKKPENRGKKIAPLYTQDEAEAAVERVKCWQYDRNYRLAEDVSFRLTEAAHILGAAVVTVTIGNGKGAKRICFTGNIGRDNMPYLKNLEVIRDADYIISESTYGNKLHDKGRKRLDVLAGVINRAYERAKRKHPVHGYGVIIIPAFAVGRVQTVLYDLRELMAAGRIPDMPVHLDSPMAIAATRVHRKHRRLFNGAARQLTQQGIDPFSPPRFTECRKWSQSRELTKFIAEPTIIIGSSGMAAGGRVLAHLEERLPGTRNTVVFVGYQGTGALGYSLVNEKPKEVTIHGTVYPVNATIEYMPDYSGHADYSEFIGWFRKFRRKPRRIFLVHGDDDALKEFKGHIERALSWKVTIPQGRQSFELT